MKELITTNLMKNNQAKAIRMWEEEKVFDLDAVRMGWKIRAGSVIIVDDKVVEIVKEPIRDLFDLVINGDGVVDYKQQLNTVQIARLILTRGAKVYYSK